MAEFNSNIVVNSDGIDDFVKGLQQTEKELVGIEKKLKELGVPDNKLRVSAEAFRKNMLSSIDDIDKAQKAAADKHEKRLKSLAKAGLKAAKSSGGAGISLGKLGIAGLGIGAITESLAAITGGLKDIVDNASGTETELLAIGKAVDLAGTKFKIVGKNFLTSFSSPIQKTLEFITTQFFKLQAGIEVIYDELKEALSLLTDGFSEDSLLVKAFNFIIEALSDIPAKVAGNIAAFVEFGKVIGRAFTEVGLGIERFALQARLAISSITREDVGALESRLADVNRQLKENTVNVGAVGEAYDEAYERAKNRAIELEKINDDAAKAELAKAAKIKAAEEAQAARERERQRRLDKINALKAEEGAIDALLNEEQKSFDTAISTGNIKEAENSFKGIEDILESLDDKIGDIETAIVTAGDVTSEELIRLKKEAEDADAVFKEVTIQVGKIGNQYNKSVNEFITDVPELTERNPLLLGLTQLANDGEIGVGLLENFLSIFDKSSTGLIEVFTRAGEGVKVTDESLLTFIKSIGISGELLNRLSEDAVDGFRILKNNVEEIRQNALEKRKNLEVQENKLEKTTAKRRKEQAEREKELIALRKKRAELEGRLSNNAEAITKVELDRINLIRDAYQESAFTIFELLLKLERLNPDDALKNFELNRDKVLDGVAERALESIQTFNDILEAKDLGEVSFDFKADGKAFIQGLTDDIKAANPILVSQIQTVIDEYNLLIDSYAQDLERLSIETADAIANAARAVNQIALREINLDLELNNIEVSNLDKALQEVIDESVAKIDYSILNTTNENEVIKQRGRDLLLLNDKEFKLRKDKLEKFYQDGIDAAEKAGEDTTLLEKEKNKELLKLQQEHAEKTEEITTKTNKAVKDNNKKLVDDAIGLVSIIGDATSQILGEVTNLLDVLGENAIESLQSQLDIINDDLASTISAIDSLESDLEGKREGRREAILRGLDLEKEREAALIDEKIKAEQKLEAEEKKQAKRRKEAAIAQALINGALAITGLVSSYAPLGIAGVIPLAIQTAATIGTTALQVATISAQQFEDGGLLEGKSHAQGGIPFTINGVGGFEAEGGEAIINKRSTAMYKPLLSAINEAGGGKKFQQGAILGADFSTMNTAAGSISRSDISELINKPIFVSVTDIQNTAQRQVRVTERSSI